MTDIVCSFYVSRPKDYPNATYPKIAPYLDMLKVLDASCRRFGFEHVVLTDCVTAPMVSDAGFTPFFADLPRNLMRATTEIQARWLASPHAAGVNTIFVGADCIIRRDFRGERPEGDVAIAYMKGHKLWRLNNGFVHVPAAARERVAPLFRLVADDTGDKMCEDMIALERALVPMPPDYGVYQRRGLDVNFVPLLTWNRKAPSLGDAAEDANVLHFMGGWEDGKQLFFDWTARWMPELIA